MPSPVIALASTTAMSCKISFFSRVSCSIRSASFLIWRYEASILDSTRRIWRYNRFSKISFETDLSNRPYQIYHRLDWDVLSICYSVLYYTVSPIRMTTCFKNAWIFWLIKQLSNRCCRCPLMHNIIFIFYTFLVDEWQIKNMVVYIHTIPMWKYMMKTE